MSGPDADLHAVCDRLFVEAAARFAMTRNEMLLVQPELQRPIANLLRRLSPLLVQRLRR